MQNKKRFKEIHLWEASWFMNLNKDQKLFWIYLNDRCDNIGVWDPNFKLAAFNLEIENSKDFFDQFFIDINSDKDRIYKFSGGEWFIFDFVKFQYCQKKPLNPKSPPHKSYLLLMKKRDLWDWFCENQPEVMPADALLEYIDLNPKPALKKNSSRVKKELSKRAKDKDPDKEKAKVKKKDKDKDTPLKPKETLLEFEMRNKGLLNGSPLA